MSAKIVALIADLDGYDFVHRDGGGRTTAARWKVKVGLGCAHTKSVISFNKINLRKCSRRGHFGMGQHGLTGL